MGDLTETPIVQPTMMDRSECIQVVDLMQYTPLGGVFYCDVFHLPPQAHQVNGWEIRQVNRKGFQCLLLPPGPAAKVDLAFIYANFF